MKAITRNKSVIYIYIYVCVAFFLLFVFFSKINPIIVFDTDDWAYIYYARPAIPLWNDWNPCRILPETLMRLCASFGVYIIYPFLNDYIMSLSFAFAFFVSVFICIYLFRFICFINTRYCSSVFSSIALSILFLLFHFLIFRTSDSNNEYLFRANDATCYFYYIIPALVNASIVLYFLEKGNYSFKDYKSKIELSILIICLYFAVFSNLFQTSILISFFSIVIIKEYFLNRKSTFFAFVKKVNIPIICIFAWIVSLVFEAKGGRSNSDHLGFDLLGTLKCLYKVINIKELNILFVILTVLIVAVSAILLIINRKSSAYKNFYSLVFIIVYCIFFTAVFNVLLCAKVKSTYIQRSDILICIFFYVFLLLSVLLCSLIKKNAINIFLSLALVITFSCIITDSRTFKESNCIGLESERCRQIDNFLIDQIKQAESEGLDEIELHVPVFSTTDNWPLSDYGVERISSALYSHHIINKHIKVDFCPDEKVNKMFDLKISLKKDRE